MSQCEKCLKELDVRIGVDGEIEGVYVLKDFVFAGCRNLVCKDCLDRLAPQAVKPPISKCNTCVHENVCRYKDDYQRFETNYKAGQGYGNGVIFTVMANCSAFASPMDHYPPTEN